MTMGYQWSLSVKSYFYFPLNFSKSYYFTSWMDVIVNFTQ